MITIRLFLTSDVSKAAFDSVLKNDDTSLLTKEVFDHFIASQEYKDYLSYLTKELDGLGLMDDLFHISGGSWGLERLLFAGACGLTYGSFLRAMYLLPIVAPAVLKTQHSNMRNLFLLPLWPVIAISTYPLSCGFAVATVIAAIGGPPKCTMKNVHSAWSKLKLPEAIAIKKEKLITIPNSVSALIMKEQLTPSTEFLEDAKIKEKNLHHLMNNLPSNEIFEELQKSLFDSLLRVLSLDFDFHIDKSQLTFKDVIGNSAAVGSTVYHEVLHLTSVDKKIDHPIDVAVEVFPKDSPNLRKVIWDEVQLLQYHHPNIIHGLYFGYLDNSNPCLVMGYPKKIECSPKTRREKLWVMLQLASAVQFLHERGISHGHICPQSMVILEDMTLKLIDFHHPSAISSTTTTSSTTTITTTITTTTTTTTATTNVEDATKKIPTDIDSSIYLDPNVRGPNKNQEYDLLACDIYSFGVTFFTIWEGRSPKLGELDKLDSGWKLSTPEGTETVDEETIRKLVEQVIRNCVCEQNPVSKRWKADQLVESLTFIHKLCK